MLTGIWPNLASLLSVLLVQDRAITACCLLCSYCAQDLGVYAGCIFVVAVLNSCGLRVLTMCTQLGGIFHLAGIALLAFIVPLMATEHQPASFVFTYFEKQHAEDAGILNPL